MKKKSIIFFLVTSITSMLIFGCASGRANLIELGNILVKTVGSDNKYVSDIKVYQDNHLLVIFGKVNRRNKLLAGSGHVDITLTGPDGKKLTQTAISYTSSKKTKNRTWNFHTKLHLIPPKGSMIQITVGE